MDKPGYRYATTAYVSFRRTATSTNYFDFFVRPYLSVRHNFYNNWGFFRRLTFSKMLLQVNKPKLEVVQTL